MCIGNICRSPMAEALFKKALADIKQTNCTIVSAGISAVIGHKADEKASCLMMARGLDISQHRACQLNTHMVRKADLILVMELAHKMEIESQESSAKGKVFRLGEWGGYDIRDPYQLDLKVFESVLEQIDHSVSVWLKKLYP
ncbi:MAG: low molecular weight phosphotyrosine protein phosphatase [Methylovulum sp.]|nr:low molecular weight phosphotyrosine protein phosphatase [Methylovulum sp.]